MLRTNADMPRVDHFSYPEPPSRRFDRVLELAPEGKTSCKTGFRVQNGSGNSNTTSNFPYPTISLYGSVEHGAFPAGIFCFCEVAKLNFLLN